MGPKVMVPITFFLMLFFGTYVRVELNKQQTVDGGMEATNPAYRVINQNVLANAPCSVGILVDRGLSASTRIAGNEVGHHIAVVFIGGPDDREALAYAWRMSTHPGNTLTVLRFLDGTDNTNPPPSTSDPGVLTVVTDSKRDKQQDDEFINKFKTKIANDETISYNERVVHNGEETLAAIRSVDMEHDLFIVGRGQGTVSPLTAGLTDWSECPELGAIGDLLASSDYAMAVSVLVIQHYAGSEMEDFAASPDSPKNHNETFQRSSPIPSPRGSNMYNS